MLEALSTASAIGGLIAFIVALIIIPWCLSGDEGRENEFAAMAWFVVIAFIVLIYPLGAISHLPPVAWLALIPLYFAIGALWFVWKWRSLILSKLDEARTDWADHTREIERKNSLPRSASNGWEPLTAKPFNEYAKNYRPEASRHKERIAGWIVLWPWSMAWTVLQWPWKLAEQLAAWARGMADRMVDNLWKA